MADKEQVAPQIGGVDHGQYRIGLADGRNASAEHIEHHDLVDGSGREAVGTREINQLKRLVAGYGDLADFHFDRDAGIIADALAEAGERVENGGLTRIGISHQGNMCHTAVTLERRFRQAGG